MLQRSELDVSSILGTIPGTYVPKLAQQAERELDQAGTSRGTSITPALLGGGHITMTEAVSTCQQRRRRVMSDPLSSDVGAPALPNPPVFGRWSTHSGVL